jgi:uncharacterized protein YndB with AHSA1/START domain/mannose-6-phosphate isomerase-like protein (cupin superfamily)
MSADVLEMQPLGIRVVFLRTAADTGGELLEMEVSGHPRGFLAQSHVHSAQTERLEVRSGAMEVVMNGRTHRLGVGDAIEVPPGTPHRQVPVGDGPGTVLIQVRPAGQTQAFLERLAQLCRDGQITRSGFPRPVAGAQLVLDFSEAGHAAAPPLRMQRALASAVLGVARPMRPYVFVDEWDVAAPPEAVFEALAAARTYPEWWRPVYRAVEGDSVAAVGARTRHVFTGRLPYDLHTTSTIVSVDPPWAVTAEVDGDLRGRGAWTLTPAGAGTHVRFDWHVHADRRLLRLLTPVLRPLFRWNHNWAIARAREGLEPYAQASAAKSRGEHAAAGPARL